MQLEYLNLVRVYKRTNVEEADVSFYTAQQPRLGQLSAQARAALMAAGECQDPQLRRRARQHSAAGGRREVQPR